MTPFAVALARATSPVGHRLALVRRALRDLDTFRASLQAARLATSALDYIEHRLVVEVADLERDLDELGAPAPQAPTAEVF